MPKRIAALMATAMLMSASPVPAHEPVHYRTVTIEGIDIFYREAGQANKPTIVLLHGFPSSSHMFRDLIPQLAPDFHVIAPDYPGFGHSAAPAPDEYRYSFDNLAQTMDRFLQTIVQERYILYLQDYGGPIGFRIAAAHPERVEGLVIQNANMYQEGFGAETAAPLKELWDKGRSPETEAPAREIFSPEGVRFQYVTGARNPEAISPDSWTMDNAFLARRGQDDIQLSLLEDYKNNLTKYPQWQAYLREHQPKTLIVWGKNDPIFAAAGAEAFRKDLPGVKIVLLDTGHFAIEEDARRIGALIRETFDIRGQ